MTIISSTLKMAAREDRCVRWSTCLLFLVYVPHLFACQASSYWTLMPFERFCILSPTLLPRYYPECRFSHLRHCLKIVKFRQRVHSWYYSTDLLLSGDVERNPGPTYAERAAKNKLKIIHLNVRSLLCHFDDVQCFVSLNCPEVLALSETWLDSSISDSEVSLHGYTIFRSDRSRCGGGVAVYVADHLSSSSLHFDTSSSGLESLWLSIAGTKLPSSIAFGCLYRPPSAPSQSVIDVCTSIESFMISYKHVVVCGDFNIDVSNLSNPHTKLLRNFISTHSLHHPINQPTRISENRCSILDLFLTSPDVPISRSAVLDCSISDHLPILLEISWLSPKPLSRTVTRRSYKHFSPSEFNDDLSQIPWSVLDIFDDVDDKVSLFNSFFIEFLDFHAPLKTIRIKKHCAPWISKSIRREMDKRNKLLRNYLSTQSSSTWLEYKSQRNLVVSLQRKAKKEYFHRLISKVVPPSTLWNTLRTVCTASKSKSTNWNLFGSDHVTTATTLNRQFLSISSSVSNLPAPTCTYSPSSILSLSSTTPEWCEEALTALKPSSSGTDQIPARPLKASKSVICCPLSSILNSSISSSTFPLSWKCSSVRPLYKGGDRGCLSNYWPISILPACSKLLEKCVQMQLSHHLSSNNLFFSKQSGFRSGHSTQSLLLYCTDKWYKSLDCRELYVAVLFLDVSKAFDTVNHALLLSKLQLLGLSSSSLSWFKSYISNRSQVTCILDSTSSPGFPSCCVPQGSVRGPTLFSAFINDLPQMLPPDSTVLFADDTTIFLSGKDPHSLNSSLQSCLDLANMHRGIIAYFRMWGF